MISDARGGHVSPGIYTEERDVTYSVKSLGITSLGLVGETLYGPAFQNVEISNWTEFVDYFGGTSSEKFKGNGNPKYELPYIAKSYLEESKRLNVVRVLGLSGYDAGKAWVIKNGNKPAIVLRGKRQYGPIPERCATPSDKASEIVSSVTVVQYVNKVYDSECASTTSSGSSSVSYGKFGIKVTLSGTGTSNIYYVSLNPSDSDYIYNVLSNRPDTGTTPVYIEAIYDNSLYSGSTYFTPTSGDIITVTNLNNYRECYRAAQTPWIVSDASISISGDDKKEGSVRKLFKFITISDGDIANYQVKVSIQNIDVKNASFDVVVRDYNDSDANPIILETFRKCNMVEGDVNYIAHRIGTSDGGYVSKSKYILVEMADGEDLKNAFPSGFLGYPMPSYFSGSTKYDMNYNLEYDTAKKAKRQYFGISDIKGIDNDVFSYKGVDLYLNESSTNLTKGFHMDSLVGESTISVDGASGYEFTSVSKKKVGTETKVPRMINGDYINETIYNDIKNRKFTICFYGGFDGWDVNRDERTNGDSYKATNYNVEYNNSKSFVFDSLSSNNLNAPINLPSTAITSDYYAYLAGVRVFANPQDVDINILATPGINWSDNALLTQEIIEIVEDSDEGRGGDTLYIMSAPNREDIESVIDDFEFNDINSSYACTYFPWVMYYDNTNKRYLNLPVTKDVVRNMAATDNKSFPWFAPAGTERGSVNCVKASIKTTLSDEDALYEAGINPVKSFAQDGVKVWGNKTTYSVDSPLNRINVRRLMIRVKKLITDASKHLIFEQYDDTLEQQFKGLVEPILADVKANRGIIDYRVITECTPETRDQHILPAKILIKPTQSLEYISISFVVYPESVQFED